MEWILQKAQSFWAWLQGLSFFEQIPPVALSFILFVVLVICIFFFYWRARWVARYQSFKYRTFWEPLVLSIVVIGIFIYLFDEKLLIEMDQDTVRNLILLTAGVVGWYFLYQRTRTATQNTEIAEQGLTVDRLNRAIKQLAHKKLYVRVGGLRGLEQIAHTQKEERMKIAHILASFIRTQAVKNYKENELMMKEEFDAHRENRLDIEIAVTILSRIASKLEKQKQFGQHGENKYDLCSLENLDLRGLRFENVDLSEFALEGTDFSGAWLRGTNFTNAHFFKFFGIKVLRAIFFRAQLHHANFTRAYLNHTFFTEADLTAVKFDNVILQNVILDGAVVNGAHFEHSNHLTQEQIDKAYYFGSPPHLPDGLELPPEEPYYRPQHVL